MPETVFMTGITGFVGSFLARELLSRGFRVTGMNMQGEDLSRIAGILPRLELFTGNLLDQDSLEACVKASSPDYIMHLAAESAPSKSFERPMSFFRVNVIGTQNLLEVARRETRLKKLVLFTSSDVYGLVDPKDLPLTETARLNPLNPYSASKVACHEIGRQYAINFNVPITEIRPFNMIGPGQDLGFVLPDFSHQVAEIIAGRKPPRMQVGRLTDQRDFIDVRDAVIGMADIMQNGQTGSVYHVCSGASQPVSVFIDYLRDFAGMDIEVIQDTARLRPSKMPVFYGSYDRLHRLTGWKPAITTRQSVEDVVNHFLTSMK